MRATAKSPETNCIQCGTRFKPKSGSVGKFCTMSCKHEHKKSQKLSGKDSYFNCCKCHALLGYGLGKSAELVGVCKGSVKTGLKALKIQRFVPLNGSWRNATATTLKKEKAWQDEWMSEYNPKFPEWRKSDFFSQYDLMSDEERKEKNRKNIESRNSCPKRIELYRIKNKKWREKNKDALLAKHKEWMKSEMGQSLLRKYRKYPLNKIKRNLRRRMRDFLKKAASQTMSVSGLIGCNSLEFKHHIEKQFKLGMTWNNYGTQWHIDHILPCASFDHNDPRQVAQCWHWTNLRPLWAKENMMKSDTITNPQMSLMLGGMH